MRKNGFTLIELLLVIVIVASISVSATIVFREVNDSTAEQDLKNLYASIQRAGKTYVDLNDNWTRDFNERGVITVSLSALQSTNYISDNLKNSVDKTNIPNSSIVKICVTVSNKENVVDKNGDTQNIEVGKYVDSCLLGKNNVCIADSNGEYETGKKNCNACCFE